MRIVVFHFLVAILFFYHQYANMKGINRAWYFWSVTRAYQYGAGFLGICFMFLGVILIFPSNWTLSSILFSFISVFFILYILSGFFQPNFMAPWWVKCLNSEYPNIPIQFFLDAVGQTNTVEFRAWIQKTPDCESLKFWANGIIEN